MGLRYMVQDYMMGGIAFNSTIDNWLGGFDSNIFLFASQGDFYQGADKDLISTITPILND